MKRISSHVVGISQGSQHLFSDFQDGGAMWTGTGPREMRVAVVFDEPYHAAPSVQAHLSMWDMDQKHNARADVSVDEITETGFTIVFKTWGDTRVARARADWLAIGPVVSEDDWTV